MNKYRFCVYPIKNAIDLSTVISRDILLNRMYHFIIDSKTAGTAYYQLQKEVGKLFQFEKYAYYVYNLNTAELEFFNDVGELLNYAIEEWI